MIYQEKFEITKETAPYFSKQFDIIITGFREKDDERHIQFINSLNQFEGLIFSLETVYPKTVIDLGIGEASLTLAAYNRWSNAKFYATDVEKTKVKAIKENLDYVKIKKVDSLKINLNEKLKIKLGSIDVAICNPPYIRVKKKQKYFNLFKKVGIDKCIELKQYSSELIFFAQNLLLLKTEGEMGIIISDSLITGKDYRLFREVLLEKFEVKTVIQLPDKIFPKTEARTYIMVLNKAKKKTDECQLVLADEKGLFLNTLKVKKRNLVERMDFDFWLYSSNQNNSFKTIADIKGQIKRGNFSYKQLREGKLPYFHSVNFPEKAKDINFTQKAPVENEVHTAKVGDILMCRVGKRCLGKLVRIKKGSVVISDCVYKISVPKKYQAILWKSLKPKKGTKWLKAYAHGVCSQVISKSDLLRFPISFSERKASFQNSIDL